jgi:23S rRNA (uracil1939-C5)-methyltransferase
MDNRCHAVVQCSRKDGLEAGFFKKQSNSIIPFKKKCLILNENSHVVLDRLKRFFGGYPDLSIDAMEIHAPQDEAIVRLHLGKTPSKYDLEVYKQAQQTLNLKGLSVLPDRDPGRERVFGQRTCSYDLTVQGRKIILQSIVGGFIQANMEMNQQLISYVAECMCGSRKIIDLYSGSGNFGIPLSFEAQEVLAVEQDGDLVKSGAELIRKNGCTNMRFLHEKALRALKWLDKEGASFDALVLDPPREGAKDVTPVIARMKFNKIIYISCNPSTLARDCAHLAQDGFNMKSIRLFDMFPQTFHIESVTVLER